MLDGQAESIAQENVSEPTTTLPSLLTLLQQLGPALIQEDNKYFIPCDVDLEQWAKVKAYASTVARVKLSGEATLPDNTYVQLSRLQGRDVLFSRVLHLEIDFHNISSSFDITFALSPSLYEIKLLRPTQESQFQTSFYLASNTFGSLSRLAIQECRLSPRLLAAILNSCQLLEEISLHGISGKFGHQDLQPLLSLPFLQRLAFTSDSSFRYEGEPGEEIDGIVEADLRPHHLSIETNSTLQWTIDLLKAARRYRCNVHSLAVTLPKVPTAKLVKLFHVCPEGVSNLTLAGMQGVELWKDMIPEAIQGLTRLHSLAFSPGCVLGPPKGWDTQILGSLRSWSSLESLILPYGNLSNGYQYSYDHSHNSEYGISLQILKTIAEGCPKLRSLDALVQLPSSFQPPGSYRDNLLGHHLTDLTLVSFCNHNVRLAAADIHSIARFIYGLFPHLQDVKTKTDTSARSHWQPIAETVMLLKSVCEEQLKDIRAQ